jgi:hypothetical protein
VHDNVLEQDMATNGAAAYGGASMDSRGRRRKALVWLGGLAATVVVVALGLSFALGQGSAAGPSVRASASSAEAKQSNVMPIHSSSAPGRYPGGIPTSLDGQPVYVGYGAVAHAADSGDDTPFLVGMWSYDLSNDRNGISCSGGSLFNDGDSALNTLTYSGPCSLGLSGSQPEAYALRAHLTTISWSVGAKPAGPVILRVHTHDALAAQCTQADLSTCDTAMVVDQIVWSGDTWTQTEPVSVAQAVRRLTSITKAQPPNVAVDPWPLFVSSHPSDCPAPWPREVFDVRGDARFGLLAVFPDIASRQAAEASLDPGSPGCYTDPRIVRPGPPVWVGVDNMLALVYGDASLVKAATAAMDTPTTSPQSPDAFLPVSPLGVDDSYRVVADFETACEDAIINDCFPAQAVGNGNSYQAQVLVRFRANALSFIIGPAQPASETLVGASEWASLGSAASTTQVYEVEHPDSTDAALASELILVDKQGPWWGIDILNTSALPSSRP